MTGKALGVAVVASSLALGPAIVSIPTASAAVRSASPATVGTLRASGTRVGGGSAQVGLSLLELRRSDYDVLSRSRSAVTLGWPRRSRAFPRRCSTVRVSLRVLAVVVRLG